MATITKLPSGRWRAQVRKRGFYRASTFELKRDATAWATTVESQISQASGGLVTSKALLATVIQHYRESVPAKGKSWGNYLTTWEKALGAVPLHQLTELHLQDWVQRQLKGGTQAVTLAGYLSTLAKVLDWARFSRRVDTSGDMARNVRKSLSHAGHRTRSNERTRLPTAAEINQLVAYWASRPQQEIPMAELVQFALASAMRQGEITRIRFEDVDWQQSTVIIRDRKDPKVKAGNDQTVPLVGEAWAIVCQRKGNQPQPQGRIFSYNPRSVGAAFYRACKACGISGLRFHDLRHAAITNLFKAGLDIPLVSLVSGHKDWKNLRRYTQLDAADVHKRLAALL